MTNYNLDQYEKIVLQAPFTPEHFIEINSNYGNIGRFHWVNQQQMIIEAFSCVSAIDEAMGLYEWPDKTIAYEVPGTFAFVNVIADWIAYTMF